MLMSSPRHRPEDLELWAELEAADLVHGERFLRSGQIEQSMKAIQEFALGGAFLAGVSWGKDSVVLAHLLWLSCREVPLFHLRPTNHNPDCDAVRDAYLSGWSGQTYSEISVDYATLHAAGLPQDELDRRTDRAWYAAIRDTQRGVGGRHALGLRAGESAGRRIRCHRWGMASANGLAPLAWWSEADVFGYLAVHGLPVHPAYAMLGGGRWPRNRLRTAEIGDTHGTGGGRREWEQEYYGDVLRRLEAGA